MDVIFALEPFVIKSHPVIFAAGPTTRLANVPSWRPHALRLFEEAGFNGTVLVPENRGWQWSETKDYPSQILWEDAGLRMADCIMFWVPRNETTLRGRTTNIEFGRWMDSGKVVLGAPADAVKMRYMFFYAEEMLNIPTSRQLEETVSLAISLGVTRFAQSST